jgi:threonylcarbamoyladenosine tRNA methylthiotransferase MtaB
MHRKYRPRHYADRIAKARALMPDCAVGADVMTGFPGETDALFEESRRFIESMPFTYLHVFTYSERPGTKAVTLGGAVPIEVRRERNRILRELGEAKNRSFRERMTGRTLSAVTLEQPRVALTTNFLRVELDRDVAANQMVDVVLAQAEACVTG